MLYYPQRAMGHSPSYKRSRYLVDRGYQLRFVARIFLVVLTVGILSALLATSLVWVMLYRPEPDSRALLIPSLIAIATMLFLELLLTVPIVFFLGVQQSRRIVGPMDRLLRTLEAIGQGDFSRRLSVRYGDTLEALAKAINKMAERLQQPPGSRPRS
ncbi:MAG: HAMP domain-containing protein [Candidatus Omnitrophota bacterium]|nr:HAMP domain-containing protein [Candidatus Omnitrophota bacterium]